MRSKYVIDRIMAAILIVVLLPLFVVIVLLVRRDGGRALFTQSRLGLGGAVFTIYKFRSMLIDADRYLDTDGQARVNRITGTGKWLRKTSIDELPQLLNILKGEMSFVGPRPTLPAHLELYDDEQRRRFLVKPGITGLAQINGRNRMPWSERLRLDVVYVENYSWWLDLKIIAKTIVTVFRGSDIMMDRNPAQVDDLTPMAQERIHREQRNFEVAVDALNRALAESPSVSLSTSDLALAGEIPGDDLFVVGNPRSGTTLTYQLCAGFPGFSYFSNLAAITWNRPELGLIIAQRFRHHVRSSSLKSSYGRTLEWSDPHECGRLWEGLLSVRGLQQPQLPTDLTVAIAALNRFRALSGCRMTYKSLLLTWSLARFAEQYTKARFVFVTRSLSDITLSLVSLYNARRIERGFTSLVSLAALPFEDDPLPERVAAQVYFNDVHFRRELARVAPERVHTVALERLIAEPSREISALAAFAGMSLTDEECGRIKRHLREPSIHGADKETRQRIETRLNVLAATS